MIRCIIVFDGRVNKVDCDDTHQWMLGSWVKYSHTAVEVLKTLVPHLMIYFSRDLVIFRLT